MRQRPSPSARRAHSEPHTERPYVCVSRATYFRPQPAMEQVRSDTSAPTLSPNMRSIPTSSRSNLEPGVCLANSRADEPEAKSDPGPEPAPAVLVGSGGQRERPRELPLGFRPKRHSGTFTGGLRSCSSGNYWTVQAGWQDTGEGSRDPLGSPSPTAGTRRAVAARRGGRLPSLEVTRPAWLWRPARPAQWCI
jgi:hypothetical protein